MVLTADAVAAAPSPYEHCEPHTEKTALVSIMKNPFHYIIAFGIVLAVLFGHSPAQAQSRLALLLGNGSYEGFSVPFAEENSAAVKSALSAAGYTVIDIGIVNRDGIKWAVDVFAKRLAKNGQDAVGIVYFAGLAIQSQGENFLIPPRSAISGETDVRQEGFPVSTILESLSKSGSAANALVLDACFGNPFYQTSGDEGFAPIAPPAGTTVALCAKPGEILYDAEFELNGFTTAFTRAISTNGASFSELLPLSRWFAAKYSDAVHLPWISSPTTDTVSFANTTAEGERASFIDDALAELAAYQEIEEANDKAAYQAYLNENENGVFRKHAAHALARIDPNGFGSSTGSRQTMPSRPVSATPTESVDESTADEANDTADLDDIVWASIEGQDDVATFAEYLTRFPEGKYTESAKARVTELTKDLAALEADKAPVPTVEEQSTRSKFTATLDGTNSPGWAGLYLKTCGSDVQYAMTLEYRAGIWTADLHHSKTGQILQLKQRNSAPNNGSFLLYSSSGTSDTHHTAVLRITPERGTRATLSIPNASIGNCAFGYLD
ncbi:caspase family protein [Hwanghaeella sp.]|uniref:caspase family protein n=1 Tax=Hwanghaeella sp. TaxID=2605943 RepID=UPI003CCC34D1